MIIEDILAFFFPNSWNEIIMIEKDNNISQWLQRKSKDLRFKYNDGLYNMFESKTVIPNPKGELVRGTTVYRKGRLGCFLFLEGNENPVDLRTLKISGNPQLTNEQKKVEISRLFTAESGAFGNFWKEYGGIITMVGLGAIIVLLIVKTRSGP